MIIFLAEIVAYTGAGTATLRYSTGNGYTTKASDTPASTYYDARVKRPANIRRHAFSEGKTFGKSSVGYGELVLINEDGALDDLLNYGFDGRSLTIKKGEHDAAYSTFTTTLVATMEQPEANAREIIIRVRDRQAETDVPLQSTKYDGDNVLPAGLEGTADDLKGKPKPLCYGVVKNVPAPCVNTSKLIYQVNDGAIDAVDNVYDRGVALEVGFEFSTVTSGFGSSRVYGMAHDGSGIFVAVAADGKIAYSTDGAATWTLASSPGFSSSYVYDVVFAEGIFVACGMDGKVATSADGDTWTHRTSTFGTDSIYKVAHGNGVFCIVGAAGKIATSPDGTTWTARTSGLSALIAGVAYGNGFFVAVSGVGDLMTSVDSGATWVVQNVNNFLNTILNDLKYGDGRFIVAGNDGKLWISDVGFTWRAVTSGFGTDTIYAVTYADGIWLAVGDGTRVSYSRDDGETWHGRTVGFGPTAVVYAESTYVIAGTSGNMAISAAATYSSEADLLSDTLAPAPGMFKYYAAGGYFRIGSSPDGVVTADVTQGANAAARTAGQIFTQILTKIGKTSADWSAADITALDTANSSVIGFWTADEIRASEALTQVAQSVGAWWGVDQAGDFRIQQYTAASGSADMELAEDQVKGLERVPLRDEGKGLPCYRVKVKYARNYTVQTSDVAGSVTDARRNFINKEWREVIATDATIQTTHLLAPEITIETLLSTEANASTEATRQLTLRKAQRDVFEFRIELDSTSSALDLGDVVDLTHSRFSLSDGDLCKVIAIETDEMAGHIELSVIR